MQEPSISEYNPSVASNFTTKIPCNVSPGLYSREESNSTVKLRKEAISFFSSDLSVKKKIHKKFPARQTSKADFITTLHYILSMRMQYQLNVAGTQAVKWRHMEAILHTGRRSYLQASSKIQMDWT